jgi:hypothetical protein
VKKKRETRENGAKKRREKRRDQKVRKKGAKKRREKKARRLDYLKQTLAKFVKSILGKSLP